MPKWIGHFLRWPQRQPKEEVKILDVTAEDIRDATRNATNCPAVRSARRLFGTTDIVVPGSIVTVWGLDGPQDWTGGRALFDFTAAWDTGKEVQPTQIRLLKEQRPWN